MTEVERISVLLRENLPLLRGKYRVKTLALFGSYVRGEQRKRSDVDILVEFEEPIGLLEFVALERELSQLIGKRVDLVMKTALKPRIGERILKEAVRL